MEKITVVIPCYRSEKTITSVVEDLISNLSRWPHEIILVCDCSPDNVWDKIKTLGRKHQEVYGILLAKNFGQHAATMAGYRHATGDIIITMDDDGQADIGAIAAMIEKIHEGYDVVYAKYPVFQKSGFRIVGSWLNRIMAEMLTGKPKDIQANSFYAMRRFVLDEIVRYTNSFPYIGGLVFRTTSNITEIEVNHRPRIEGNSTYTLKKLIMLWVNGFTAFSVMPLRVSSMVGLFFSCAGFLMGMALIIRKLLNPEIILGYTSMMASMFFLGGVILLSLGLIGEYVGRIYIGQNQAPQYVIKEETEKEGFDIGLKNEFHGTGD